MRPGRSGRSVSQEWQQLKKEVRADAREMEKAIDSM
jgi:hypothetical protein